MQVHLLARIADIALRLAVKRQPAQQTRPDFVEGVVKHADSHAKGIAEMKILADTIFPCLTEEDRRWPGEVWAVRDRAGSTRSRIVVASKNGAPRPPVDPSIWTWRTSPAIELEKR